MSALLKLLGVLVVGFGLLVGGVLAYHWSRIRECEKPLHKFLDTKARREDVVVQLGPPFEVARPSQANEYARRWAGLGSRFTARMHESAETLVYMDGEFVWFMHLGGDGRVMEFTCIGN